MINTQEKFATSLVKFTLEHCTCFNFPESYFNLIWPLSLTLRMRRDQMRRFCPFNICFLVRARYKSANSLSRRFGWKENISSESWESDLMKLLVLFLSNPLFWSPGFKTFSKCDLEDVHYNKALALFINWVFFFFLSFFFFSQISLTGKAYSCQASLAEM